MAAVRLFDKNKKLENPNRIWYRELEEKTIKPELMKFTKGVISDADIRKTFVQHAALIRDHYKNLGESTGNLQDYADGFNILNKYLDEMGKTKMGYMHLLPTVTSYMTHELSGRDYVFKDELGMALDVTTKNNHPNKKNGKRVLIQVTCLAERDLLLLCQRYAKFFFLENREFNFDSSAVSFAVGLPGITKVVTKMVEKQNKRLHEFETGEIHRSPSVSKTSPVADPPKP
jgi:hypothetical protein